MLFHIGIERHCNVADNQGTGLGYFYRFARHFYETLVDHRLEFLDGICEIGFEVDAEHLFDLFDIEFEVAHEIHDHRFSDTVVFAQLHTPPERQFSGIDRHLVLGQIFVVLCVVVLPLPDAGQADAKQIDTAACRIALKVAVQFPFLDRLEKLVVRLGEVVHANHFVAMVREEIDRVLENCEFDIRAGNRRFVQFAHRLLEPWHMGIVEDRQTIRIERIGQFECLFKTLERLIRQPVDQVDVDALDVVFPGQIDRLLRDVVGLDTVNRLLDDRFEILDTETDTVETVFFEHLHLIFIEETGVDFAAHLRLFGEFREMFLDAVHNLVELLCAEKGRRTAAEMELHDFARGIHRLRQNLQFTRQIIDIADLLLLFGGEDNIAAAEIARASAKRQMNVDGKRLFRITVPQFSDVLLIRELFGKFDRRRIAGIPRARLGVFDKLFEIDFHVGKVPSKIGIFSHIFDK